MSAPVVLAPLSGITDAAFRRVCRDAGAAMVTTEMVSADGVVIENTQTLRLSLFDPEERPVAVQVFGADPRMVGQAVRMIMHFRPDCIDINCGCPADKVVSRGAGAALLQDLPRLVEVARAAVENSQVPVTVKMRSGWYPGERVACAVAVAVEAAGVAAVTVHPRAREEFFDGPADWSVIREVKRSVGIPVVGCGDIRTPEDAARMRAETGCDGVMIGRGCLGNPWIFARTVACLETGESPPSPTDADRVNGCLRHFDLAVQIRGEFQGMDAIRRHLEWYLDGLPEWPRWRSRLVRPMRAPELRRELRNLLAALTADPARATARSPFLGWVDARDRASDARLAVFPEGAI